MAQQVTLLAWHSRLARTFHLSNASLLGSGLTLMQTSQAHELCVCLPELPRPEGTRLQPQIV